MNDASILQQISAVLYQSIVSIQQQQPEFLVEKYRGLSWEKTEIETAFMQKLEAELGKAADDRSLRLRIERCLKQFFVSDFFKAAYLNVLNQQIHSLLQTKTLFPVETLPQEALSQEALPQANSQTDSETDSETDGATLDGDRDPAFAPLGTTTRQTQSIAVLLLDAENMMLSVEEEQLIQTFCNYPIQIKIAVANWRSGHTARKDATLHRRGYQMIHVPGGKNSADMKMTAIGSSIFIYYPNAKEICVCSSDGDLTHLCNTLQAHGLSVYAIRKQAEKLILTQRETGKTQTHILKGAIEIPTLEQTILLLKALIAEEQVLTSSQWIKLSQISVRFKAKHHLTLSQVAAAQSPNLQAREIFTQHPKEFVTHQLTESDEIYVSLFASSPVHANSLNVQPFDNAVLIRAETIASKVELEQALIKLMRELTIALPNPYIGISVLQNAFQQEHGYSVRQALQDANINLKYLTLLRSCTAFILQQTEKEWQIALAEKVKRNKVSNSASKD